MSEDYLGKLYIAATPIGNLDDVSKRFSMISNEVDGVLCEDTRHSKKLFYHLNLNPRLLSFHQHNEDTMLDKVIARLLRGEKWMLVSDAGTPLIQDPGYKLVAECHQKNIPVSFIPGACAVIGALCLSGQPTNQFQFIGYLPNKEGKRKTFLSKYIDLPHSVIFYLSTHRIIAEMHDIISIFGASRQMSLVKEITKVNERVIKGVPQDIIDWLELSPMHLKGEFALVIEGFQMRKREKILEDNSCEFIPSALSQLCITELRQHLPLKTAAKITEKITSQSSKDLYRFFMLEENSTNKI